MTKWEMNYVDWTRFMELRRRLFKAIKECLEIDGHCKSYEGRFDIGFSLPNYFEEQGEDAKATWELSVACYLVGPSRGEDWYGDSFGEVLDKAEAEMEEWFKHHDEWIEKVRNDPTWILS